MIRFVSIAPLVPLIASQLTGDVPWAPLAGTGITGIVLFWFMSRNEQRMKTFESSLDRSVRANLLLVLGFKQVSETVKDEARSLLSELDAKSK